MRIGLIARGDARGLGIQCKGFHDAMRPARTVVIDCPSANPLPLHRDWYPDATWIKGWPTAGDFRSFLDGLDVVYTAECDYTSDGTLYSLAGRMGVKTVLHLNWELFDHARNPNLPRPSLFAAPSMWHFAEIPEPRRFLPVPIETDRFPRRSHPATARRFLHVVGRPAIHDRNGTRDLLAALRYVRSEITIKVTCQDPDYVPRLLPDHQIPANVTLEIATGDVCNYWDLYADSDALVLPRRFGGLCLPAGEALGAGMPVVMPAISPNEWLPADWLVPATRTGEFMAKTRVDLYSTDVQALAAKIDQFASDPDFYQKAAGMARDLAEANSWQALKPLYERTFAGL